MNNARAKSNSNVSMILLAFGVLLASLAGAFVFSVVSNAVSCVQDGSLFTADGGTSTVQTTCGLGGNR